MEAEARQLKEEGNQCFKEKRIYKAVLLYTSSLEKNVDPVVLGNRAQCYINLQKYDFALMDCNRSLELDPNFVKGLFRRSKALEAMGLFVQARADLERLVQLSNDTSFQSSLSQLKNKLDVPVLEVKICEKGDEIRSVEPLQQVTIDCYLLKKPDQEPTTSSVASVSKLPISRIPSTYSDLMVGFSLLQNYPPQFAEYFMKINPELYHRLFDDVLDVEVVSCLLKGLSSSVKLKNFNMDPEEISTALLHLSVVKRFEMISLFLSAEDKNNLQQVCNILPDTDAELINSRFSL